jgi:hypothetical protein
LNRQAAKPAKLEPKEEVDMPPLASARKILPTALLPQGGGRDGVRVADLGHFATVFMRRGESRFMATWRFVVSG